MTCELANYSFSEGILIGNGSWNLTQLLTIFSNPIAHLQISELVSSWIHQLHQQVP